MWGRFLNNEKGFTGLEAAIVLIAFVVVAAVFSYVMLGAGFFTTQKSQEVVHTGVAQASSSLAPSGDMIVESTVTGMVGNITFYVTNTAGGTSIDLNKAVLTYTDNDDFVSQQYGGNGPNTGTQGWNYSAIIYEPNHNNNLLESGEKYRIDVNLTGFGVNAASLPGLNEKVNIEFKPPEGAVLGLSKTMPPALTAGSYYTVY
jgi:archaeal flagellin FlaB